MAPDLDCRLKLANLYFSIRLVIEFHPTGSLYKYTLLVGDVALLLNVATIFRIPFYLSFSAFSAEYNSKR